MSEWQDLPLSEVVELVGGGTPKTTVSAYWNGDIPWLSVVDFNTGRKYVTDTEKKITKAGLENSSTKLLNAGDIILSARGTVGAMAVLSKPMTFNQSCYGLRGVADKSDTSFIYYLVKDAVDGLQQISHGGVFDTITRDTFKDIALPIPPLEEQKAIASVLSSLDDKIDLLHRQNTTLERMAETLFRKCFIEEAQEDWKEKPLSSIANFLNGLACQKFPPTDGTNKLPVLKIKELSSGISENSDWATLNVKPEYIVENGDVIFAWSASLMVKVWDGEKCVLNQHLFKVTSQEFPKWFYLHWCKYHLDEFISISSSHATTMGHIKRGDLDTAMVKVPKPHELEIMSEQMTPLLEKQITNSKQIKTLEKIRDTLLPRLMSGELRIQNV